MVTNPNHPSSFAAFEANEKKSKKAIFGPGEVKEKGKSFNAELSVGEDYGIQGSTDKKYPKVSGMTDAEQDAYFAEGLDPAEVLRV